MKFLFSFLFAIIIAAVASLRFTEIPLENNSKKAAPINLGKITQVSDEMKTVLNYQVRLVNSLGGICGGTLMSANRIVTAAHCLRGFNYDKIPTIPQVYEAEYVDIYVGVLGYGNLNDAAKQRVSKSDFIIHPKWWPSSNNNNDLAIIKLAEPIAEVAGKISYLTLPSSETCQSDLTGKQVMLTGWGGEENIEQMTLRVNQVPLLTHQDCFDEYTVAHVRQHYGREEHYTTSDYMQATMLCAAGNNDGYTTCRCDTGGPLVYTEANNKQVLLGVSMLGSKTCDVGAPGGFSSVCVNMEFFQQNL